MRKLSSATLATLLTLSALACLVLASQASGIGPPP
jgi:hypothetical protein